MQTARQNLDENQQEHDVDLADRVGHALLDERRADGSKLVVTGCMAERYGDELAAELPEVDQVAGFGQAFNVMPEERDGTEVPVSLAFHKDTPLDGSAPALQYAYGSYGSSTDPWFSNSVISTRRQLAISSARSTAVLPTQNASGMRMTHSISSWRNAASVWKVALMPATE